MRTLPALALGLSLAMPVTAGEITFSAGDATGGSGALSGSTSTLEDGLAPGEAGLAEELLRLMAMQAQTPSPAAMRDLEFPVGSWEPVLLERLFAGPLLLDPGFDPGLPPAPANDALDTQMELVVLLEMQRAERTGRELTLGSLENTPGLLPADRFAIEGLLPAREVLPELWDILDVVNDEVLWFTLREKLRASRPRPSALEPNLRPAIEVPAHPAYPSGHASHYRAAALVLGELNPPCAHAYLTLTDAVAHRREILGVHFPSDTAAGQALGEAVARALLDSGRLDPLLQALVAASESRGVPRPDCGPA